MTNRRRSLLLFLLIAAAIGGWLYLQGEVDPVEKLFGGRRAVEIVAHPDAVQAYRLGHLANPSAWLETKVADFPHLAGPAVVSKATAGNVSTALLSSSTYSWDLAKGCTPSPGVLLSFAQGDDRVDVLFCFECDILLFARNGEIVRGGDFDFGRSVFVAAAKECFPDDQEIQQLNEQR